MNYLGNIGQASQFDFALKWAEEAMKIQPNNPTTLLR